MKRVIFDENHIKYMLEKKLDCYQMLYKLIIYHLGENGALIGLNWPWEFRWQNKGKTFFIEDTEFLTSSLFEKIFAIKKNENKIENEFHFIELLKSNIDKGLPTICSYDYYYSFYHYKNIYKTKHGDHAILIDGYDDNKQKISFISAIPYYRGEMHVKYLFKGIKNHISPTSIYFEKLKEKKSTKSEILILFENIEKIYANYKTFRSTEFSKRIDIKDKVYSLELTKMMTYLIKQGDIETLNRVVDGKWLWDISKKWLWTKIGINSLQVNNEIKFEIFAIGDEINNDWLICCRILYKAILKGDIKLYINVLNRLKVISNKEIKLLNNFMKAKYIYRRRLI